jgi:hypothetical protein
MVEYARALPLLTLLASLVAPPATAATSRISNFLFACDGTNKTFAFTAGAGGANNPALPANTALSIVSAEVVLFENQGGLQYVLLAAQGDRTKQLANLGLPPSARQSGGGDHAFNTSTYDLASVTTNAAGQVVIQVDGACNPGFGNLQGTFTVWFTGPGIP